MNDYIQKQLDDISKEIFYDKDFDLLNPYYHISEQILEKFDNRFKKVNHEWYSYDLDFCVGDEKIRIEVKSIVGGRFNSWDRGRIKFKYFDNDCNYSSNQRRKYQGINLDLSSIINDPLSMDYVIFLKLFRNFGLNEVECLEIYTPQEIIDQSEILSIPNSSDNPRGQLTI